MKKNKLEFSKALLIQESVLVWVTTLICLFFGYLCIVKGYLGSLPWITSIISASYAAYGVSQACYYKKSEKENTKNGIKYETVLTELQQNAQTCQEEFGIDLNNAPTELTYPTFYTDTTNPDEYQI